MNVEEIFSQLEGKVTKETFQQKIQEKIDEFGGLLSEEGAALIVATDLGVDLRLERPREFLHIKDLTIGMADIWLYARVSCVSGIKEFQRDSGTGKVSNVEVMDKTGSTRVVFWDDLADRTTNFTKGDVIEIRGGYVKKGFREGVEIHLSPSRRGTDCKITEPLDELPECRTEYTPVAELEEEMADVDVVGRVGQLYGIREFQKNGGTGKVASLSLVDDTGEIRLCLWNDKADIALGLKRGDIIAVEGGYTKIGLSDLELHSGWRGRIIVNPQVECELGELPDVQRASLIDLEPGKSCNVSGSVTDIGERRTFVKSDGTQGQLASFELQDDTAEIRVLLWNEKAEEIDKIAQGISLLIDNGFCKEGMTGLELHVSSLGRIAIEECFEPETKIFNMEKGPVDILGRYYKGEIIDESGRVPIKTEENITDGDLVRVKGVYETEIQAEKVEKSDEEFPSLDSLLHPPRKVILDLEGGEYTELCALVKKVLDFDKYQRIRIDDSTAEVMGVVIGDVLEGGEYCFYARTYKREQGIEFVCYQYYLVEAEKEAFHMIQELEALMEV